MEHILTFGSTSHSIRAEQLLLAAGLSVSVMPLPSAIRAGCGLCLRVAAAALPSARVALDAAGVPIEHIYLREPSGSGSIYTPYSEEAAHENP